MVCTRCRSYEAAPDGVLCRACEAAAAHPAPPQFQQVPQNGAAPAVWLRSPVGLGWVAVALLGVVIATDLFAVWTGFVMYDTADALASGDFLTVSDEEWDRVNSLYVGAGVVQLAAWFATGVVFLVWFHRVRVNAEVFNPFGHSKTRGWAVGGWFVPIVNLWFPRRIALDIWDASSPLDTRRSHGLVNAWWAMWLIGTVAGRVASSGYERAETAEEIRDATVEVLITDALDIAAAVLAILFVLTLTRMQDTKARSGPGTPAPVAA
ncbi:DUF4328 domain-containing protein [Streptomyces sp. NPDC002845]